MKKSIIIILAFLTFKSFAQTTTDESIKYFENCIINETSPSGAVDYKYQNDYRIIVWNDQLIKNYKYSNEVFDKLGYDYMTTTDGDNNQYSKIYRNCDKGIVIEVTEWYNLKLSISIQWYSPSTRNGIGYLLGCSFIKQNEQNQSSKNDLNGNTYYSNK